MQDLSGDLLEKVFKSGLHLPDWAALRLVSQRWKALANSCADCVNVDWTDAEWEDSNLIMRRQEFNCSPTELHLCYAKATVSRLYYVL